MTEITLQGNKINTNGDVPKVGSLAPEFILVDSDLKDVCLSDYDSKNIILNIIPSLDTPVCQKSTKIFNERASTLSDTVILAVSADLPFAMKRFCSAESIESMSSRSIPMICLIFLYSFRTCSHEPGAHPRSTTLEIFLRILYLSLIDISL